MADYPVVAVEGVDETTDFAAEGLPEGIRVVSLETGKVPFPKSSLFVVAQLAILLLLRTPGRDIFAPEYGAGFKELIGLPVSPSNIQDRRAELARRVASVEDSITSQLPPGSRDNAEVLDSLTLLDADYDYAEQAWNVTIRLVTADGGAADILL